MGDGTMGHRLGLGAIHHVGHGMPDTNIRAGANILTHISSAGNGSSSLGHCNTTRNTETFTSAHYGNMVHQVGYLPLCDRQHLAHAEQLLRHQQQTWTLSNLDLCQNQQNLYPSTSEIGSHLTQQHNLQQQHLLQQQHVLQQQHLLQQDQQLQGQEQ